MDRRWHSSVHDVRSFRAAECDTDQYLVVAKFRERMAVSKQTAHRIHMEKFNLRKLNEVEAKGRYSDEFSNRFAALVNLDLRWILIEIEKLLERIAKFQSKNV
jgi:hypothetical protein